MSTRTGIPRTKSPMNTAFAYTIAALMIGKPLRVSRAFSKIIEPTCYTSESEITSHPYTLDYLIVDPLGREDHDVSDTRIYRNANRLTAAAANGGTLPITDLTDGDDGGSEGSAGDDTAAGAADAASATAPASGEEGTAPAAAPVPRVRTPFAALLEQLQLDLYLFLRSNVSRFMDETSNNVITNRIKTYEHDKGLTGRGRIHPDLRYT